MFIFEGNWVFNTSWCQEPVLIHWQHPIVVFYSEILWKGNCGPRSSAFAACLGETDTFPSPLFTIPLHLLAEAQLSQRICTQGQIRRHRTHCSLVSDFTRWRENVSFLPHITIWKLFLGKFYCLWAGAYFKLLVGYWGCACFLISLHKKRKQKRKKKWGQRDADRKIQECNGV